MLKPFLICLLIGVIMMLIPKAGLGSQLQVLTKLKGEFYDFSTNTVVKAEEEGVICWEPLPSFVKGILVNRLYKLDVEIKDQKGRLKEVEIVNLGTRQLVSVLKVGRDGNRFKLRQKDLPIAQLEDPLVLGIRGLPVKVFEAEETELAELDKESLRVLRQMLKNIGIDEYTQMFRFGLQPSIKFIRAPEKYMDLFIAPFEIDLSDILEKVDQGTIHIYYQPLGVLHEMCYKDLSLVSKYFATASSFKDFIEYGLPYIPNYQFRRDEVRSWSLSQDKGKLIPRRYHFGVEFSLQEFSFYADWEDPLRPLAKEPVKTTVLGSFVYRSTASSGVSSGTRVDLKSKQPEPTKQGTEKEPSNQSTAANCDSCAEGG